MLANAKVTCRSKDGVVQIQHVTPAANNRMVAGTPIGDSRKPTAVVKQLGSNSREDFSHSL